MYCWLFYMVICVLECFKWQCVLLGLLGGNMYCWVFYVVICVVCFRWQCVLLGF